MNNLEISKDVYFDCVRRQLKYDVDTSTAKDLHEIDKEEYVNRYAIVRRDTGNVLGIHTDDYIIRPYSK